MLLFEKVIEIKLIRNYGPFVGKRGKMIKILHNSLYTHYMRVVRKSLIRATFQVFESLKTNQSSLLYLWNQLFHMSFHWKGNDEKITGFHRRTWVEMDLLKSFKIIIHYTALNWTGDHYVIFEILAL